MISTSPTSQNKAVLMTRLREAPGRLEDLVRGRKREDLQQPLGKGQRSFRENLVHLLNSEAVLSEAVYQILLLKEPELPRIHPERDWGKLVRYQDLAIKDLLGYFKLRRRILLGVLENLSEKDWLRTGQEAGKKRHESVYWKIRTLVLHESDHIQELEKNMSAEGG